MSPLDRRTLLKTSAAAASVAAIPRMAFAGGQDTLRIGLVGCGGRGTGAAIDCLSSSEGIELVAMGDLFGDRVESSKNYVRDEYTKRERGAAFKVTDDTTFVGWDSIDRVLESGIDVVLLATPPQFRPMMLRNAVDAGVHVFMEKPVAVDPTGIRSVIRSGELAKSKGLGIVSGTQRRHQGSYIDTLERIKDGAIGEIVGGDCWWNQGGLWMNLRKPEWTDMEWQLRNWLYFDWLSGDHIVEQHIHNLDVMNWALDGFPVAATALGGRQVRTDPAYGHVFDHFAVQYEYAGGQIINSQCRQIDNCENRVGERLVGTHGTADPNGRIFGPNEWSYTGNAQNPYVQEHADLVASIRNGTPINEAERVAKSTLTAIMGRMAAYTGKKVTWEFAMNSKLNLTPAKLEFGDLPVPPVATPGETRLV